jgi:hypothetical protein
MGMHASEKRESSLMEERSLPEDVGKGAIAEGVGGDPLEGVAVDSELQCWPRYDGIVERCDLVVLEPQKIKIAQREQIRLGKRGKGVVFQVSGTT